MCHPVCIQGFPLQIHEQSSGFVILNDKWNKGNNMKCLSTLYVRVRSGEMVVIRQILQKGQQYILFLVFSK